MKQFLVVLFLILALNIVTASSIPTTINCGPTSTYDAATNVYTCKLLNANTPGAFGVGAQAADVLINDVEFVFNGQREIPLDRVNLEIINPNIIFPDNTNITFSREKFENITINSAGNPNSKLSISNGGNLDFNSNNIEIRGVAMSASEVKIRSAQVVIFGGMVTGKLFLIRNQGSVQPKYLNVSSIILSPYVGLDGVEYLPAVLLQSAGDVKLERVNWGTSQVDLIANNLKLSDVQFNSDSKLTLQAVENITADQFDITSIGAVEVSSGKYITLQTPQGITSDSYITVTAGENVTIRSGEITSNGKYYVFTNDQGEVMQRRDFGLNALELNWKNKSGVFIKAGKNLLINNQKITSNDAKQVKMFESDPGNSADQFDFFFAGLDHYLTNFYSLSGRSKRVAENHEINQIDVILENPPISNEHRKGNIGVKMGETQCILEINNNQGQNIAILPIPGILAHPFPFDGARAPFIVRMNSTSCTFYQNGQELGKTYFAPIRIMSREVKIGYNPFRENYFESAPRVEFVDYFAGVSLVGESMDLNIPRGISSSSGVWVKAPILATAGLNQQNVIYSQLLSRADHSTVISCNDDHGLAWLRDPADISASGVCPAQRNIYIYGQLARGGVNITTGSIKVVQIVNLRTSQIVNYTYQRLTQNWNATFNDAFDENGTFGLTLGNTNGQRFNAANPTLITEGGRHEVTLLIDPSNNQFTTPCPDGQCILHTVTVNAQ